MLVWSRASGSKRSMGRQGMVEFDDYYSEADVCLAFNLLADDQHWLSSPDVRRLDSYSPQEWAEVVDPSIYITWVWFLVLLSTQVTYHAGPGAQYNYTQDTGEATMDVEIMVRPQLCVSV